MVQIYRILNIVTNKSYIGKSVNYIKRFEKHKKAAQNKVNRRLYDSMNHHGIDKFQLILIEDLGNVTRTEANIRETYWVEVLDTLMPNGYNMTKGGDGGYTLDHWDNSRKQELYKLQALSRTGQTRTDETKEILSQLAVIREASKTEEQKNEISLKISKTNKERGIAPPEYTRWKKGQVGTFLGKTHKESSKLKIGEARLGKKYEDFLSIDKAKEIKEDRRKNWIGNKNPNYVDFTEEQKNSIIEYIKKNKKTTMNNITLTTGVSPYIIRSWVRDLGFSNFIYFCKHIRTDNEN